MSSTSPWSSNGTTNTLSASPTLLPRSRRQAATPLPAHNPRAPSPPAAQVPRRRRGGAPSLRPARALRLLLLPHLGRLRRRRPDAPRGLPRVSLHGPLGPPPHQGGREGPRAALHGGCVRREPRGGGCGGVVHKGGRLVSCKGRGTPKRALWPRALGRLAAFLSLRVQALTSLCCRNRPGGGAAAGPCSRCTATPSATSRGAATSSSWRA